MVKQRLIRWLMRRCERVPSPDEYRLNEIFDHPAYIDAGPERRREIERLSSQEKYEDEQGFRWDAYFGMELAPLLRDKVALDLGSFTGGRSIAWAEHYGLRRVYGIDVDWVYARAATRFAAERERDGRFSSAVGEHLPFRDGSFEAVLTFDVFEHTREPGRVLAECRRVLKPGGRLFVVFPGYFHPVEHHLSLVTLTPCLHWFFGGNDLIAAYNQIVSERGRDAEWYARRRPELADWERGCTINGTTIRAFRRMVGETNWIVGRRQVLPLLRVGRRVGRRRLPRLLSHFLAPFARLPLLEEILCHRIVYILRKP